MGHKISSVLQVQTGCPQGSILGPTIYNILTNDIPDLGPDEYCPCNNPSLGSLFGDRNCNNCTKIIQYADDTSVIVKGVTKDEITRNLEEKLKILYKYLTANGLCVNQGKTKLLVGGTRQRIAALEGKGDIVILENGKKLDCVSNAKILGVQVASNFCWRAHFELGKKPLLQKLRYRLSLLYKIVPHLSFKDRLIYANAIFLSRLTYGCLLWAGQKSSYLKKLQVVQNCAVRAILRTKRKKGENLTESFKFCNWLNVKKLSIFCGICTMKKYLEVKEIVYLNDRIVCGESEWDRRLEDSSHLVTVRREWRLYLMKIYEKIPSEIKAIKGKNLFKNELKNWLGQVDDGVLE